MLPPQTENKTRMFTLTSLIRHSAVSALQGNKARKENKMYIVQKERKLSLFTHDMISYLQNPRNLQKKIPKTKTNK